MSDSLVNDSPIDIIPKDVLFCYLDILGYKEMVKEYFTNDSGNLDKKIIHIFKELYRDLWASHHISSTSRIKIKMVSDSIIITLDKVNSINEINMFYRVVSDLVITMLDTINQPMLVRGSIVFGKHYEETIDVSIFGTDLNNDKQIKLLDANVEVTISNALIEAYLLESEKAKYPRIIIDDTVINFMESICNNKSKSDVNSDDYVHNWESTQRQDLKELIENYIILDIRDKSKILNIFNEFNISSKTNTLIAELYETHNDINIKLKYLYLKELIEFTKYNDDKSNSMFKFRKLTYDEFNMTLLPSPKNFH